MERDDNSGSIECCEINILIGTLISNKIIA